MLSLGFLASSFKISGNNDYSKQICLILPFSFESFRSFKGTLLHFLSLYLVLCRETALKVSPCILQFTFYVSPMRTAKIF